MLTNRSGKLNSAARTLAAAVAIFAHGFAVQIVSAQDSFKLDHNAARRNDSEIGSNYKLCWLNAAIEVNDSALLAANERLLLPQPNGVLLALNAADGKIAWRSDLGGEVTGRVVANQEFVFAANTATAAEQSETTVFVRAVSLETGVTAWRAELPKSSAAALALANDRLLLVAVNSGDDARNRQIVAFNVADGARLWSRTIDAQITTPLAAIADKVFFAASDNQLRFLKLNDGAIAQQFRLPHNATELIASSDGKLLIYDRTGLVSALRARDGKKLWTARLGGAVQQLFVARDAVVLSSLDDFVYFYRLANGKRRWSRRLAARPIGGALVGDKALLLAVSGETNFALLDLSAGKTLGQIAFPADADALGAPLIANDRVFAATSRGVAAWQPATIDCAAPQQ